MKIGLIKVENDQISAVLRKEAQQSVEGKVDQAWIGKVEELSRLCHEGVSSTHLAFLVTAMLAKSINRKADLFAIKPTLDPTNQNAFSARTLCHSIIVPLSAELGFSIGVTGREPLNNQPYFRMTKLGDDTPVHKGGKAAFDYMVGLVSELNGMKKEIFAREALRAYIHVRKKYQPRYADHEETVGISVEQLASVIENFVRENSEGGKRAQAVVAGLMDIFTGDEKRVESGRINDPSRNYPGDVCVRDLKDLSCWERAFEVRDKPVLGSDIHIFGKKCVDLKVREVALVMVSDRQKELDSSKLQNWANEFGIGLTLFYGWKDFIEQALFWSREPKPLAVKNALKQIHSRLISVEVSVAGLNSWKEAIRDNIKI